MPYAVTSDEVKLYYEEVGQGTPILFVHEFAGDPSQLGAAAARVRQALSLHHLRSARLQTVRRAEGRCRECR
jgi:hypothetical protein